MRVVLLLAAAFAGAALLVGRSSPSKGAKVPAWAAFPSPAEADVGAKVVARCALPDHVKGVTGVGVRPAADIALEVAGDRDRADELVSANEGRGIRTFVGPLGDRVTVPPGPVADEVAADLLAKGYGDDGVSFDMAQGVIYPATWRRYLYIARDERGADHLFATGGVPVPKLPAC